MNEQSCGARSSVHGNKPMDNSHTGKSIPTTLLHHAAASRRPSQLRVDCVTFQRLVTARIVAAGGGRRTSWGTAAIVSV